jgi:hypothetical protein
MAAAQQGTAKSTSRKRRIIALYSHEDNFHDRGRSIFSEDIATFAVGLVQKSKFGGLVTSISISIYT